MRDKRIPKGRGGSAQKALNVINRIEQFEDRALSLVRDKVVNDIAYAGFLRRLAALTVDMILVGIGYAVSLGIIGAFDGTIQVMAQFTALYFTLAVPFYFIAGVSVWRKTAGKFAVGVYVSSEKSNQLSLGQVMLREIGKVILSPLVVISGGVVIFTKRKLAIHDWLASTSVRVEKQEKVL